MILDFHVHVFPAEVKADRGPWLARDATFAELYRTERARIATADDLLRSMDDAAVDVSVMQGFAWTNPDDCRRHNDALLDAAARFPDRLIAFCTLNPAADAAAAGSEAERCIAAGARGFGELRPDAQGYGGHWDRLLPAAEVAQGAGTPLLVHASEPLGHHYPGKGAMTPDLLLTMVESLPGCTWVLAHLGGGLPFYGAMPEVRHSLLNTFVDTAAWPLLYGPEVFPAMAATFGTERILFGSDYPLQAQARSLGRLRAVDLPPEAIQAILGGNAARLLGLSNAQ